ncbi:laccase-2 precursor [Lindgomyces ingoldianus]|uniref:Laccase-2 n=1 Tax=Lindgomyces ingoldianus TaxID=673940 RepID=A0ACB6Q9T7_9PLEO|nr:laccase-2 precursor [Lindgomyces ingoldianus]KAF2463799.1 laccase-2 precursor [Lindgomyces ingoldianus]
MDVDRAGRQGTSVYGEMLSLILLAVSASLSSAKTVTYDFDIGWVSAAPDGFTRPVIGINGQWPIPTIEANKGDTIVVKAKNSLGNETTSLHFHGMYQFGTPAYDGALGVTQCGIAPGQSFTYTFEAAPSGTHWYHSHAKGQYPDGLRGKMIIHDPAWEKNLKVDEQIYLSMSDWYHTQQPFLIHEYLSPGNHNGDLPSPDSFLFNDTKTAPTFSFKPGKRYLLRIVNVAALACGQFHVDGHKLTVVEIDGVQIRPQDADTIVICAGQRYDVIVESKKNPFFGFKYIAKMTIDMLTKDIPSDSAMSVIGNITYKGFLGVLDFIFNRFLHPSWVPQVVLDDISLRPLNNEKLYSPVTKNINFVVNQTYYGGVGTRIKIGNEPWVEPKVPSLYTALSTGAAALDADTYGVGVDPWISNQGDVIQVYLKNPQVWPHPMHLHGHEFQVVARGVGEWDHNEAALPKIPMMRDTVVVPANGYIVLRWLSNNPGVWFFHCHIDMHLVGGMASIFIENPTQLQQQYRSVPSDGIALCEASNECYCGNCLCRQGNVSMADAESKCNTIFNTYEDGEPYGALVASPCEGKRILEKKRHRCGASV